MYASDVVGSSIVKPTSQPFFQLEKSPDDRMRDRSGPAAAGSANRPYSAGAQPTADVFTGALDMFLLACSCPTTGNRLFICCLIQRGW